MSWHRALARPPGLLALGPLRPELVTSYPRDMRTIPPLADRPERQLTLYQADQARD